MRRSITRRNSSSSSSLTSSIDSSSNYQQSTPPLILSSSSSFDHQYLTSSSSSSFSSSSSSSSSSLVNYPPNFSDSNRIMKLSSDLSTDLKLGPGISTTTFHSPREELALMISAEGERNSTSSLFVKVKMEGIRIARKVDLLAHAGYPPLINTLEHMFPPPNILWAEGEQCSHRKYTHVLTYEDQEGDWMMVGDVPWEMFLATVKKLKITRIDSSSF